MKTNYLALSALLLTPLFCSAEETDQNAMQFGLVGAWDSRLGDQWGIAITGDKGILSLTVGGFITSQAEDNSIESVFGNFGNGQSFDSEATTWSLSYAWIFSGSLRQSGLYAGLGYSGATIEADIQTDGISVSGSYDDSVVDGFVGYVMPMSENLLLDFRVGYGYSLGGTYEIVSEVSANGQTVRQRFSEEDFGDIEYEFLDEFYGSIQLIYRF